MINAVVRFHMCGFLRAHLPEGRSAFQHTGFAARISGAREHRHIAIAALGIFSAHRSIIGQKQPEMLGKAIAELVLQFDKIARQDIPIRLAHMDLPLRAHDVVVLIIADLGADQQIRPIGQNHITRCHTHAGVAVINELGCLHIHPRSRRQFPQVHLRHSFLLGEGGGRDRRERENQGERQASKGEGITQNCARTSMPLA